MSKKLKTCKRIAFTLAEVLITLGIIGVVAAMTLPALIGKYEKMVTVNKLKRSYTTISQMFTMARKDYGDPNEWNFSFGDLSNGTTSNFETVLPEIAKTYFLPYLDVVDDCGLGCSKVPKDYKWLNGNLVNQFHTRIFYTMFLKDGSIIYLSVNNNGITMYDLIICVDINGIKKPNIDGKDVFAYYLTTTGVTKTNFWGLVGSNIKRETLKDGTTGRECNKNANGEYCGALIQYDNWSILDDYPW